MTEEFQNARDIAHSTFEQAKVFAGDIAYMYWFSQNMSNNPKESYIGSMYVLYHASAKGLDLIANTLLITQISVQVPTTTTSSIPSSLPRLRAPRPGRTQTPNIPGRTE